VGLNGEGIFIRTGRDNGSVNINNTVSHNCFRSLDEYRIRIAHLIEETYLGTASANLVVSLFYRDMILINMLLWKLGRPSKIRPTVSSRQNIPAV